MAPRAKVERVQRNIRLRKEVDDELRLRAQASGLSVNAYLEGLLDWVRWADRELADLPRGRKPVEVISVERPRETYEHLLPAGVVPASDKHARIACAHPRKSRQVFSWGAKCGDCGARL